MQIPEDYLSINKSLWNKRTPIHIESEFYSNQEFLAGKSSLNDVELDLLGDINGKSILHLQCHFGQDSLSLARLGAEVVGLDFSENAIAQAKLMNDQLQLNAQFICGDVNETASLVDKKFEIVFTSYGTICWLPDLTIWANQISQVLKENGKLIYVEFHPAIMMFDYSSQKIVYSYFNDGPIIEENMSTYTESNNPIPSKEISWNHPISEVLGALIQAGLNIEQFHEYPYSPYDCFDGLIMKSEKYYQFEWGQDKLPMVYSIVAGKSQM